MPDPQEQPRRSGREAHFPPARTNNSPPPSEPTYAGGTSAPTPDGPEFEQLLERHRELLGVKAEEAQLRMLDSVADLVEAKAEEAAHKAAAEPRRQTMSLRERAVKLLLVVVVTLSAIGLAIAAFLVSPWLLSLGLPPSALGAWKWFGKEKEDHKPPSDDEGGP